jgi:HD-GYP domain-containing protein (c-di-GMP phosphodiesterase class II)
LTRYPNFGAQVLEASPALRELASAVRHRHERWDGRGYPGGLSGVRIPLVAHIIAVADAYDAMVTDRPYQARRSPDAAVQELLRCAGTRYDSAIVRAAIPVLLDWQEETQQKLASALA